MEAQIFAAFIFFKKTPKHSLLKNAFANDLSEDYKKITQTGANLLMQKTKIPIVKTVNGGDLNYHYNWKKNGLATILVSNKALAKSVAHVINLRMGNEFTEKIPPNYWSAGTEDSIYYTDLSKIFNFQNRFSLCTSPQDEIPNYVESTETIFDLYLSTLSFSFPEMTPEITKKIKLFHLRKRKSAAISMGLNLKLFVKK